MQVRKEDVENDADVKVNVDLEGQEMWVRQWEIDKSKPRGMTRGAQLDKRSRAVPGNAVRNAVASVYDYKKMLHRIS